MSRILGVFEDTIDPDQPILHIRKTARVFVINAENKIGMVHIRGIDEFGVRDHLETCGGGIELNETARDAVIREAREELGVDLDEIVELGVIEDEYHRLQRHNHSTFFAATCGPVRYCRKLTTMEQRMMVEPVWCTAEELSRRIDPANNNGIAFLIAQRDFCAWNVLLNRFAQRKNPDDRD